MRCSSKSIKKCVILRCTYMMTSSNGNISTLLASSVVNPPVTGGFPSQRPLYLTECTLHPHSKYHKYTLGCHSIGLVKSLTNRNTLQNTSSALQMECTLHCHFYSLVFVHAYTPIPLRGLINIFTQDSHTSIPLHALLHFHPEKHTLQCYF